MFLEEPTQLTYPLERGLCLGADYRIDVTSINRGFFLDTTFVPGQSFLSWRGDAVLTPQQPEAIIWGSAV